MSKNNWNRYQTKRHIKRKQYIIKYIYNDDNIYWDKNQPHRLNKQKIHCSCPFCSPKTRNKGDRKRKVTGNYSRHLSYKWSDLKKIISMDMDEFETLSKRPSKKRKE